MIRIGLFAVLLFARSSLAFGDGLPDAIFRVESTTLNLTVMDQHDVLREPTECFLIFHDSLMILLFRHSNPEFTEAEGVVWKITEFDKVESKAVAKVQRFDSRAKHQMQMNWDAETRVRAELTDDFREVDGKRETVKFRLETVDQKTAKRVVAEILGYPKLRLPSEARDKLLSWIKGQSGEPSDAPKSPVGR
jgi:hypothetical protein